MGVTHSHCRRLSLLLPRIEYGCPTGGAMKFSEEQTIKFVLEYVKHECLFNSACLNFKNKRFRKAALHQLSQKMKIPGFGTKEAYVKMRSLKSTYFQEKKKIQQSKLNGDRYVYKPNVKWFDILDNALRSLNLADESRDFTTTSATIPNYVQEEENNYEKQDPKITVTQVKSETDQTDEELWLIDENNEYSIILDSPSPANEEEDIQTDTRDQGKEETRVTRAKNPRKRRISTDTIGQSSSKMASDVSKMAAVTNNGNFDNEFDIFGKSVGAQLKNMPFDLALEAQMYIQKYLSEIRLKNYRRTSTAVLQYDDEPFSP